MITRRRSTLAASALVLSIAIALGYHFAQTQSGGQVIKTRDGLILVAGPTSDRIDAGFESRLAFTPNGCLGFTAPDQTEARTVVIFPAGTKVVRDSPLTIRVNGRDVRVGDTFTGGGGGIDAGDYSEIVPGGADKCMRGPLWLMNPED